MALGDLLTHPIESSASTGLIAAITDHRGIREIAAAGVRKAGCSQALLTTDAIHIGSNTKAMTATMLATLVDDGVFPAGWDTTIADVFPELLDVVHPRFHPIDLWRLVTMTGGMKPDAADWYAHPGLDLAQRRYRILRDNLADPPTTLRERLPAVLSRGYRYSNLGYVVAGAMAERATGQAWETLMRERLFEPLAMSGAGFGPPGTPGELDQPWGHRRDPQRGEWVPNQVDNAPALGPAGTVHLRLEDWSRFMALWLPDAPAAILDRGTLDKLITPTSGNFAAGWIVAPRPWARGRAITHSGSNASWYTILWIAPVIGQAYVVGSNAADPDPGRTFRMLDGIVTRMIDAYLR